MADKMQGDLNKRLDAIEAQLNGVSKNLDRLNSGLESLVKSQLIMGTIVEAQQTSEQQAMIDAISNQIITKMSKQLGQDAALLSDQLVGAIGTALGKRDAVNLAKEASREKPLEIMWSALSQFQPETDKR